MARKVPDDKRGKKKPSASATRSPGGGEAARRKAATAYTKSPVGQARSPKGRAKNKRNKEIAFATLSLIPVAGTAGKAIKAVSAAKNVKTVKSLYNQGAKAKYKAKFGKDAVPEANKAMRALGQKRYSSEKLVKKVYGRKPSPAQSKEIKSAYERAGRLQKDIKKVEKSNKNFDKEVRRMIEKETKKNYKSESSRIKSTIRENKNNPKYNAYQKDIDKAYRYELKAELKDLKGKTTSADVAYRRAGHHYLRAGHPPYTKSRMALEMGIKKSQAARAMNSAKKPAITVATAGAAGVGGYKKGLRDAKRRPSNTGSVRGRPKPVPRKPRSSGMKARPLPRRP